MRLPKNWDEICTGVVITIRCLGNGGYRHSCAENSHAGVQCRPQANASINMGYSYGGGQMVSYFCFYLLICILIYRLFEASSRACS